MRTRLSWVMFVMLSVLMVCIGARGEAETTALRITTKEDLVLGEVIHARIEALLENGEVDSENNGTVMVDVGEGFPTEVGLVKGVGEYCLPDETVLFDDFENFTFGSGGTWSTGRSGAAYPDFSKDTTVSYSGSSSAKIYNSPTAGSGRTGWFRKNAYPIEGGKFYYLSVWVKTEEMSGNTARIRAMLSAQDNARIYKDSYGYDHFYLEYMSTIGDINYQGIDGTRDWTQFSAWFYAPPQAASATLDLYYGNRGTAWFDDFHLATAKVATGSELTFEAWLANKPEVNATKTVTVNNGIVGELAVSSDRSQALAGTAVEVSAEVRNQFNQPMEGETVTLELQGPPDSELEVTNAVTDAEGKVYITLHLGEEAGTCIVTATVADLSQSIEVTVIDEVLTLLPAATTVLPNENLAVIVQLQKKDGEPVAGRELQLAIAPEASIIPAIVITDEAGEASFEINLTKAGSYELIATDESTDNSKSAIIDCIAGPVSEIQISLIPGLIPKSNQLSTTVQANIFDDFENIVADGIVAEFWLGETMLGESETLAGIAKLETFLPEGNQVVEVRAGDISATHELEVAIPSLLSPQENTVVLLPKVSFKWEVISGTTKYLVDCATDANFTEFLVEGEESTENELVLVLNHEGTIYWRVQAPTAQGLLTTKVGKLETIEAGLGAVLLTDSFDETFDDWGLWNHTNTLTKAQDSEIKYHGTSSLSLSSTGNARGWSPKRFPIQAGEKYEVSAWIRTDSIVEASLRCKVFDANNDYLLIPDNPFANTVGDMDSPKLTGTNEWQKVSLWFMAPEGTKELAVQLMTTGPGTAWFDLLEISVLPADYRPDLMDLYYVGVLPSTINAANPLVGYNFLFAKDAQVTVVIYDLAGRVVRNLVRNLPVVAATSDMMSTSELVKWDGRGDDGREVANGLYLSRIEIQIPGKAPSVVVKKVYVMR